MDAPHAQLPMHYPPNGLIPDYRPFGYPHRLAPHYPNFSPQFVPEENFNELGGCEPDSSEARSASPSEEPLEPDEFADITGNHEMNVKNLFFAINLFENKQPDSFMLPGQPAGPDSSPLVPMGCRPFMGGRNGRRGMYGFPGVNGVVPGPHFTASPVGYYVVPHMIPPAGSPYVADDPPKTRGTGTYLPLSVCKT